MRVHTARAQVVEPCYRSAERRVLQLCSWQLRATRSLGARGSPFWRETGMDIFLPFENYFSCTTTQLRCPIDCARDGSAVPCDTPLELRVLHGAALVVIDAWEAARLL